MKRSILSLLIVTIAAACLATGCVSKKPGAVTPLRGQKGFPPDGDKMGGPTESMDGKPIAGPDNKVNSSGLFPTSAESIANFLADREVLKSQTVYFEYDSSVIRKGEEAKLKAVISYLTSNARNSVQIEGHCDERGTEEYNRSLGERRALALREFLANSGISPSRVLTISFGKDQPADPGHDESAWSKNRRGVFIGLTPKQ